MAIGSKSSRTNLVAGCATCVGEIVEDGSAGLEGGAGNVTSPAEPCEKQLQLHLRLRESRPQHPEETSGADGCATTSLDGRRLALGDAAAAQTDDRLHFPPCLLPARKAVGLTKVRLEDCLRCDACSCIYLDQSDYDKHMRNFHRHHSPKKHRQRRGCRSCCRFCNCREDHQHQSVQKERGNNNLFHYNIKDRWTKMVSRRLNSDELMQDIKHDPEQDPDDCSDEPLPSVDFSHLLSQVEVKIKTEPAEDQEFPVQ